MIKWNWTVTHDRGDYILAKIPDHPNNFGGYVLEHRAIMENHLGRLLTKDETVHHKDGNKKNNDINNLELLLFSEHSKLHANEFLKNYVKLKCPWCGKEFEIARNKSFLVKPQKYQCNCCSNSCRGKLYRTIQLNNNLVPEDIQRRIDNCLIDIYKKDHHDNKVTGVPLEKFRR